MLVGLLAAGAISVFFVLATIGKAQGNSAMESTPKPEETPEVIPVSDDDTSSVITTDPDSWPTGDRIWDICRAIAIAEGYNVNGAAFKLNNPGDISDGANLFGAEYHGGSNVTKFPDARTGWNWLYSKIRNHVNGNSSAYPESLTITEFAKKYAGSWENWKNNVSRELGVNPDSTTFSEYVNA